MTGVFAGREKLSQVTRGGGDYCEIVGRGSIGDGVAQDPTGQGLHGLRGIEHPVAEDDDPLPRLQGVGVKGDAAAFIHIDCVIVDVHQTGSAAVGGDLLDHIDPECLHLQLRHCPVLVPYDLLDDCGKGRGIIVGKDQSGGSLRRQGRDGEPSEQGQEQG